MSTVDDLAVELACPYCGAAADVWCQTSGGHTASYLHGDRTDWLHKAWSAGYREGLVEATDNAALCLQRKREGHRWTNDVPLVGVDVIAWLRGLNQWARS